MNNKYDDIINLPHHISTKHSQMSLEARAAQFAPFAALTGYDDEVKETARLTNERIELDEESKSILDNKIQMILEQLSSRPTVSFTYFIPDAKKDGGRYETITGIIKRIDDYKKVIVLENKEEIPINEIIDINKGQ
jgi:hypothetical protein